MDYLSHLPKLLGKDSEDVLLARKMIEDSRASQVHAERTLFRNVR